jgi:hypothetical protein
VSIAALTGQAGNAVPPARVIQTRRCTLWVKRNALWKPKIKGLERLDIGELEVGRLRVRELIVERERTSRQGASASSS